MGIIWIILALSEIPIYLYPLPHRHERLKSLAKEVAVAPEFIKEEVGVGNKTQQDLEKLLIKEMWIVWSKSLLFILAAIFAGYMIIRRQNIGRLLAIALGSYILILKIINIFTYHNWQTRYSLKFYSMFFHNFPVQSVLGMITFWLSLTTVIFFSMPSTIKMMKIKKET